jgi:flagellar motor switch protein FliN
MPRSQMKEPTLKSAPQVIELPELHAASGEGQTILSGNLDIIQGVKVKLSIRVGETIVSVGELMNMKEDHVLKLDTSIDAPVDVLLEGNVVARGQLVAVDDNFGVRITELPKVGNP